MTAPILAFDIETIPDVAGLRRLHNLPDTLGDSDVVEIVQRLLRQKRGNDFFPLHLHRVATISCVLQQFNCTNIQPLQIFSLPRDNDNLKSEEKAIHQFFELIEEHKPTLISWNGSGFDLPVLHYRAMIHRQQAATYWRNSYLNRYQEHHTDLMDVLAMYQVRAFAPLNEIAVLCGFPGKIGIGGAGVWAAWQKGDIDGIRRYCEVDSLLTYLLYVRYLRFRGENKAEMKEKFIREQLEKDGDRWEEFLSAWKDSSAAPKEEEKQSDGTLI